MISPGELPFRRTIASAVLFGGVLAADTACIGGNGHSIPGRAVIRSSQPQPPTAAELAVGAFDASLKDVTSQILDIAADPLTFSHPYMVQDTRDGPDMAAFGNPGMLRAEKRSHIGLPQFSVVRRGHQVRVSVVEQRRIAGSREEHAARLVTLFSLDPNNDPLAGEPRPGIADFRRAIVSKDTTVAAVAMTSLQGKSIDARQVDGSTIVYRQGSDGPVKPAERPARNAIVAAAWSKWALFSSSTKPSN